MQNHTQNVKYTDEEGGGERSKPEKGRREMDGRIKVKVKEKHIVIRDGPQG